MKTFRVSTAHGDTYKIKARSLIEAKNRARENHDCRVTVYEEQGYYTHRKLQSLTRRDA